MIESEADRVYKKITNAFNNKLISEKEYEDIVTLCNDVVKEISKGSQLAERLVEIMGNEVLKTAEERGEDRFIDALRLYDKGYNTLSLLAEQGIPENTAQKAIDYKKHSLI